MSCPPDKRLTYNEIAAYAQQAGFSAAQSAIATAIAIAESGGCPSSHNGDASTGDDSWGLWQINYFGSLSGSRTQQFGPASGQTNPATNAASALSLFKSSGWAPWSTYGNGAYRQFLPTAQTAADFTAKQGTSTILAGQNQDPGRVDPGVTPASGSTGTCYIQFPGIAGIGGGCLLGASQARALVGGAVLAVSGVVMLSGLALVMAQTKAGRQLASVAGPVLPGPVRAATRGGSTRQRDTIAPGELEALDEDLHYQRTSAEAEDTATRAPRTRAGGRRGLGVVRDAA